MLLGLKRGNIFRGGGGADKEFGENAPFHIIELCSCVCADPSRLQAPSRRRELEDVCWPVSPTTEREAGDPIRGVKWMRGEPEGKWRVMVCVFLCLSTCLFFCVSFVAWVDETTSKHVANEFFQGQTKNTIVM